MLTENQIMKTVRHRRLNGKRLRRTTVQNHRIFIVVVAEYPGLAISSRATEFHPTLRKKICDPVRSEVNSVDPRLRGRRQKFLF